MKTARRLNRAALQKEQNTIEKEYLYVGHYIDKKGRYILKIGTTNDLARRKAEHTRNYRKVTDYSMPADGNFEYDWHVKLSKYNTLRFEDKTRQAWKDMELGKYIRNDRFYCARKPDQITITIRKTYTIPL